MKDPLNLSESKDGAPPTPADPLESTRDRQTGLVLNFPAGAERREVPASRIRRLAESFGSEVRVPVRIKNAIIKGDLDLRGTRFRHGLIVTKSEFRGRVFLSGAVFEGTLNLRGSRFERTADFAGAHVEGDCDLTRAEFKSLCRFDDARIEGNFVGAGAQFKRASFRRAAFARQVLLPPSGGLRPARFRDSVDFSDSRVGGAACFNGVVFDGEADFRQVYIAGSASFRCYSDTPAQPEPGVAGPTQTRVLPTTFGGKLNFARAVIEGKVTFEGARFHAPVDFQRARISSTTDFSSYSAGPLDSLLSYTCFLDEVDFTACQIDGGAAFLGTYFKKFARFERIQVGGHLLFKPLPIKGGLVETIFDGGSSFLCARVHNNAEFDGVSFNGQTSFDHLEVERNVYFRPAFYKSFVRHYARFSSTADFVGARIRGDAEFTGAQFSGEVRLESIHVEGNAFFDDEYDSFTRPVERVSPVLFEKDVDFISAHFKHRSKFNRAVFRGAVKFESADFEGAAIFDGTQFMREANFTGARFGQHADFKNSMFEGVADFTSAQIAGAAFFNGAAFLGRTTFLAADFKSLNFEIRQPPTDRRNFDGDLNLKGFTYELIDINENLLGDIFSSMRDYNRQSFTQLERVLRSIGQDNWADDTYLERRKKERAERKENRGKEFRKIAPRGWRGWHDNDAIQRWFHNLTGQVFDTAQALVGNYGIRPFPRLLGISLLVLAMGTLMFWQEGAVVPRDSKPASVLGQVEKVEGQAAATEPKPPNRGEFGLTRAIGLSFNQFIPIVQIPSGSRWKPSEKLIELPFGWKFDYFSYAFYGTIHSLLGAILVPLGVAALTGVLHRREKPGK